MSELDNNRSGRFEDNQESYINPYVSESSADIYATPEVVETVDAVEITDTAETETVAETENTAEAVNAMETASSAVPDTHGLFSGNQPEEHPNSALFKNYGGGSSYGNPYQQQGGGYGGQPQYGTQPPYSGQPTGENPYQQQGGGYGSQPPYGGQPSYGSQPPYSGQPTGENPYQQQGGGYGSQPPYGGQPSYGSQPPYSGQSTGENPYQQQGGSYGGQPPYGTQLPYSGQPMNGNPYQQQGGGYGGLPPFGGQPPYDNPYSPYALPQKKQPAGLIVGIVIAIIILFLIAVFALASKAVNMLSEKEKEDLRRDVYEFDDYDYDYDYDHDYDYDYDYGEDDDYWYDDPEIYLEDDQYYSLQDDIRYDLSYEVEFEDFEYDTEYDNVYIGAGIPVISGDDVPNLETLNESIQKEVNVVTELFEKEYESHIKEDEDSYFEATLSCYVTYMDEDRLSIVYDEQIYCDLGGGVYLICVNVDMKNGVVLDNEEMLVTDDDFSVDFRQRSDEQNGEISYLDYMTDQQITDYFNSDNIIVFYTPKGMEIGFNYEAGWVTVTYEEYEEYLKVF